MTQEQELKQARLCIEKLTCWQGDVRVEELSGGITNRNYLVTDVDGSRTVVRLCSDLPHLGIDRRNEVNCQRAAWEIGVAPRVLHIESGVLVSEFVDGATCTDDALRDTKNLTSLARTLRRLHDAWDCISGEMLYFSPFQTVRTYASVVRELGAEAVPDLDDCLEESRQLAHQVAPFRPTLCHNDLLAANVLIDADRASLVDWEYAGIGHPLFDLAGVSGNVGLSPELETHLLLEYGVADLDSALRELKILRAASLLREALWACIQTVKAEIDFDYRGYAVRNFEAYRQARGELER